MFKTVVICFVALFLVASINAQERESVCDICQLVVSQVEQYINQTEPEIEKQLVKACSQLPPQIEGLCDTIVLVYGHQIIQALLKKETPEVLCQQLRLCPKKEESVKVAEQEKPMSNDLTCTLCKLLVNAAEKYISQNKTEQQVVQALEKVCDALPSMWRSQCKAVVDQYTPQIIEFLKQQYPPEKICQEIKLCPAAAITALKLPAESPVPVSDTYCDMCHQIVEWVENYIEDNRTSEKIIEALTKVCSFTGQYEALCKSIMPVIWQQLVQKIHDQEPPGVVCKQLHLCANATRMPVKKQEYSSDLLCNGCKYLVAVADNFITKDSTEQQIVKFVEKGCQYFPESYRGLCQAVVDQYGPELIQQLAKKVLDPTKACTAVRACPAQAPRAEEIVAMHGYKIQLN